MKISEFISQLDSIYPKSLSAPWDTDGLQCCADPDREIKRVLVALDAGINEINYACAGGYDLLLTHHPMIFGKAGDIIPSNLPGNRIIKLITSGVAAASFHTRLDAGESGVNDCLAETLGFTKTITFGDDDMPSAGRITELSDYITAEQLCLIVKEKLGAPSVRLTGDKATKIKKIAMVGGSGKDFVIPAKAVGADIMITGEVSYNSALDFTEMGITVIEAGHFYTEFPVCTRLASLVREIAGVEADVFSECLQNTF